MSFTQNEIKEIKYSKRYGYIFSAAILALGALLTFLFSTTEKADFIDFHPFGLMVPFFVLSVLILYGMNNKLNKDLRLGQKLIETKRIDKREKTITYEVGSGSLYLPILGNLFPKIWGQEMKGHETFQLTINGEKYDVDQDLFNMVKEGDNVELHWTKYGEVFLGLKIKN